MQSELDDLFRNCRPELRLAPLDASLAVSDCREQRVGAG